MTKVKTMNKFIIIEKQPVGVGKVDIMTLTLEQAKVLRDQIEDSIDELELKIEKGEG